MSTLSRMSVTGRTFHPDERAIAALRPSRRRILHGRIIEKRAIKTVAGNLGATTGIETGDAIGIAVFILRAGNHGACHGDAEAQPTGKAAWFLKADMKRPGVTYAELVRPLEGHGLQETKASIISKLARGTFAAVFMLATMEAL